VAIKILTTHATQVQENCANELAFLRNITNVASSSSHVGRNHVSTLLDTSEVKDGHGSHLCLVYEAMGSFTTCFQGQEKKLPVTLVKNVAKELLLALDFLHRECHVIHTGASNLPRPHQG
jgi:serine/threonine-protein kinase SRPK3